MKINRRNFKKQVSSLPLADVPVSRVASAVLAPGDRKRKSIGIQIYSVLGDLRKNTPTTLKRLADIGFTHLELCNYADGKIQGIPMLKFRRLVEDAGLQITGAHALPPLKESAEFGDGGGTGKGFRGIYIEKYTRGNQSKVLEFWKRAIDDHVLLGLKTLVQPALPIMDTREDALLVCEIFNRTGELAKASGIRWGYHNHSADFKRVPNDRKKSAIIYDLLLENTDPALVFFEMDVYWTVMAQCDPVAYFKKYPGRFPVLHIKDRTVIGASGFMNFPNIFAAAYAAGQEWYYAELEYVGGGVSQIKAVEQSFRYLAQATFVK